MSKNDSSKEYKDTKYPLESFYENDNAAASGSVHFDSCEICDSIELDPRINNMSRLLKATVKVVNCCPGKEITVGCIVTNTSGKVLAYKSETFIARRDKARDVKNVDRNLEDKGLSGCGCSGSCIDVVKIFNFILPNSDICSVLDVIVKVIANYTSPCNSYD